MRAIDPDESVAALYDPHLVAIPERAHPADRLRQRRDRPRLRGA